MESRGDGILRSASGVVTVAVIAWEVWLVAIIWRGGRLPVPFISWTTEGHPFVALLLLFLGTPFLSVVAFALTMAVAAPLALLFKRPRRADADQDVVANDVAANSAPAKPCPGSGRFAVTGASRVECNSCGYQVQTTETEAGRLRVMAHTTAGVELGVRMGKCPGSGLVAGTSAAENRCPKCGQTVGTAFRNSSYNRRFVDHLTSGIPRN